MFRFLGAKVIHISCERRTNGERLRERGTLKHQAFLDLVPDLEESRRIAQEHRLQMTEIDTSLGALETRTLADLLSGKLNPPEDHINVSMIGYHGG